MKVWVLQLKEWVNSVALTVGVYVYDRRPPDDYVQEFLKVKGWPNAVWTIERKSIFPPIMDRSEMEIVE